MKFRTSPSVPYEEYIDKANREKACMKLLHIRGMHAAIEQEKLSLKEFLKANGISRRSLDKDLKKFVIIDGTYVLVK